MKNTKMMIVAAIFAGIIAVLAQISVPIGPVPNTAQPLAMGIVGTILGKKWGAISVAVYVLMGAIGLPVFAGGAGGIVHIFGPTGWDIISFPIAAFVVGLITEQFEGNLIAGVVANWIGTSLLILGMGFTGLRFNLDIPWSQAFAMGVMPFILTNPVQGFFAGTLGTKIKKQLKAAGLLEVRGVGKTA